MYTPFFSLNLKMLNSIGTIERLYGQLYSEKLIPSLSLRLFQENQILATHYSTSIEGNPLSPQDVTNVILGDQVPTTKSEREVKNYFHILTSLSSLARAHTSITVELTEKFHYELMDGLDDRIKGHIRNGPVFVGHKAGEELVVKHNPPFHDEAEIKAALGELYTWVKEDQQVH